METIGKTLNDSYISISQPAVGSYKDSGSKFLSLAYPVVSEDEVRSIIAELRKKYFDATHHCYAYRLGIKGEPWRASDDGEPSSTAGRPIYGEILSNGLSDILVVVVRWFGGTKLGVPGLIKAYKSSTESVLDAAKRVEKQLKRRCTISYEYPDTNTVMKVLKEYRAVPYGSTYGDRCTICADIRLAEVERFAKRFADTLLPIELQWDEEVRALEVKEEKN